MQEILCNKAYKKRMTWETFYLKENHRKNYLTKGVYWEFLCNNEWVIVGELNEFILSFDRPIGLQQNSMSIITKWNDTSR